jgi:branched-chain amino acid transport system substrate-binding protein
MVVWGINAIISSSEGWEAVEGKCEDMSVHEYAATAGYPLTSKSLFLRDSYVDRWGDIPHGSASGAYDTIRYILADAIERAGTIETEAVIEALEKTEIETSLARNFVYTESHDVMIGKNPNDPNEDYMLVLLFQWQDGERVPVYPKRIMEEAGASYTYPPWSGPWDNIR